MKNATISFSTIAFAFLLCSAFALSHVSPCFADASPTKAILEMNAAAVQRLAPSSSQITAALSTDLASPGINVTIQPGAESYPGLAIKPDADSWDLSAFGHVEAKVVNTGTKAISLSLRVDNAGDWQNGPWNAESDTVQPGETGVITTIFGFSYGHKPGYALKSAAVVNMLIFAGKSDTVQSFRIVSLVAGGVKGETPPVKPEDVRTTPKGGELLGGAVSGNGAIQIVPSQGVLASLVSNGGGQAVSATFPAGQDNETVTVKPAIGRWDLREYLDVHVRLRNTGKAPVTPRARLESNGGATDWISAPSPLAPGAEGVLTVPFASAATANLNTPGTGNHFANDSAAAVIIGADKADAERSVLVEHVVADNPPSVLPAWLGKRPPVDGDWSKTLDDEFNGTKLNTATWHMYGENYWDKASHWSKDNLIVGGGVARLRYTKTTGFNNDDPNKAKTAYAGGYLDTFGLWTQRYGYFEARMKLPTAPGLWPAFWMMPDRGAAFQPSSIRGDTGNGGMEFDVMEHLDRWGPHRYNIAMHWDGYGKDHKSNGSDRIYVQPDRDGYITCGLLWTPGSATYYCNGEEVLRWLSDRISNVPEDLMFTIPQGGWDNNAVDDSKLPDDFVVDYVRVWQRKDLVSP